MERVHSKQGTEIKYYFMYKTTNVLTGSFYIGVHSTSKINDLYLGSGRALHQAFKTYGKHNFKREILEYFASKEDMYKRESEIVTPEFVNRLDTYNLTVGGRVPEMTDAIKQKISQTVYKNNPRRGTKDPEHSKRMTGTGNPMYGKSRKGHGAGKSNGYWKGYYITPAGIFETRKEAGRANGISGIAAADRCKRNYPGYSFRPK